MYEVEVKVPADHDAVRERLAELGAERVGRVLQSDTYYAAPHRDFAETDEALRIRRERAGAEGDAESAPDVTLTYKGPLVEEASKTREERETAVGDDASTEGILAGLGFEPVATVEKDRERYRYRGYAVTLDRVAGLGEYVEVEREADEDEIDAVREGALEVLCEMGLDPDDQVRTSYLGLLLAQDDASQ